MDRICQHLCLQDNSNLFLKKSGSTESQHTAHLKSLLLGGWVVVGAAVVVVGSSHVGHLASSTVSQTAPGRQLTLNSLFGLSGIYGLSGFTVHLYVRTSSSFTSSLGISGARNVASGALGTSSRVVLHLQKYVS